MFVVIRKLILIMSYSTLAIYHFGIGRAQSVLEDVVFIIRGLGRFYCLRELEEGLGEFLCGGKNENGCI